jgi:hypothetical protein
MTSKPGSPASDASPSDSAARATGSHTAATGPHAATTGPHAATKGNGDASDPHAGRDDAAGAMAQVQRRALALVESLADRFREQVERALKVRLDGSITSLAFVDHYLALARDEDREPIVSLLAAGAGAYFGELVRRELGGTWVGDGQDPRRLRLLIEPQFVHFSPVDQAYEAIAGRGLDVDDPRLAPGPAFDSGFGLEPSPDDEPGAGDAPWLEERLAELPPVPEDEFHSLTCRFETLQLMLELLAAKHVAEGLPPRRLGLEDYVQVLTMPSAPR